MKRLILSLGILISALAPKVASAQSLVSPCVDDLTPPTVTWNVGDVGKTTANPIIIKLSSVGYAAIVADSGNGTAGVNKAKVAVPAQFTQSGAALFTIVDAEDACASTYTGMQATKWPKFTISKGAFTCADVNASKTTPLAITYNVFDEANNVSTGTIYVKVVETVKPTVTTKPATLTLSATGSATLVESDVVLSKNDNCGAPTVTLSKTAFTCDNLGSNTVYVKVTDASGNKDSATAIVTVVDATAPNVTLQNPTLYLDANGSVTAVSGDVILTSSDACDLNPTVVITPNTFDCSDLGTNTVTVTVTDASGNQFSGNATVTVEDNLAPVVTTQNITVSLDATGNVSVVGSDFVVTSSDNCDVPTYSVVPSSFTCDDLGVNNVSFTASDASGNDYTTVLTVTVVDDMNPTLTVQNVTLYLDANGDATLTEADAVVSKGDNCSTPVITFSQSAFDCSDAGTVNVDVTATDAEGNATTETIVVTVVDNIDPVINLLAGPFEFSLGTDGTVNIDETDLTSSSTDNCNVASVTVNPNSFDCTDIGSNTVTITATDDNGNSTTETVTVTIVDDLAPILTVTPFTAYISNNIGVGITNTATILASDVASATDNCGTPTITLSQTSFDCSETGANTITVTATDAEGNVSSETVVVTVVDNSAPQLIKLVYERDLANGFAILSVQDVLNEIAADNCAVDYATSALSREYFDCEDVGSNTVTASIFDFSGNFSFVNFTVIIHDTVAPVANAVATYTVYLDQNGAASLDAEDVDNGSSDDCDNFTLSLSKTSFDCDDLGSNTVTFTISDEEVNSSTATVNVVVMDTIRPVWGGNPADISFYYSFDQMGAFNPVNACILDNDPNYVVGSSDTIMWNWVRNSGYLGIKLNGGLDYLENYNLQVYFGYNAEWPSPPSGIDGNYFSECSGLVPTALSAMGNGGFTPGSLIGAPSSNNHLGLTYYTSSDSILAYTISGSVLKSRALAGATWLDTLYDGYGPMLKFKWVRIGNAQSQLAHTVYLDQNGSASIDPQALFGSYASDNCDFAVTSNKTTFTCVDAAASPVNITLTATDDAGNTRNTTAIITVLDTLSPVVNIASAYDIYLDANGQATLEFADIDNGTADNCTQFSDLSVVLSKTSFDCGSVAPPVAPGGQPYTVSVTVTDLEGNDRSVSLVVTVHDTLAPVASVDTVSYTAVLDINGAFTLGLADITPSLVSFSDNCGVDNVFFAVGSTLNYDCDDAGNTITVTLVAVDEAGNESEVVVNVNVADQYAPVWNTSGGMAGVANNAAIWNGASTSSPVLVNMGGFGYLYSTIMTDSLSNSVFASRSSNVYLDTNTYISGPWNYVRFTNVSALPVSSGLPPVGTPTKLSFYYEPLFGGTGMCYAGTWNSFSSDVIHTFEVPAPGVYYVKVDQVGTDFANWAVSYWSGWDMNALTPVQCGLSGTVALDANGQATLDPQMAFGSYVTDNCDYTITSSITSFDCEDALNSPIEVTLTATDPSGNSSTQLASITVEDNIAPTQIVLSTYTATLDANGSVTVNFSDVDNGSFDNCDFKAVPSSWTYDCDDIGSILLSGSLIDSSGNSTPFSVNVTVEDKSAPVFDSEFTPANVTVYAVQYDCFGLVNVDANPLPSVTDNCDEDVDVVRHWAGQIASGIIPMPVGQHTLWAVATDDYGNVDSTAYAYVEVIDTTLPDATFWNNVTVVLGANGTANITPATIIDASYDNCGIENILISPNTVDCDDLGGGLITSMAGGTGYVTLTVTLVDFNGNSRTYNPMVAVEDQSAPTFVPLAGAATVALDASGSASVVWEDLVDNVVDNCFVETVTLSQASFDCTDLGVNNIVITATDPSGNASTYTAVLNVVDNLSPVFATKNITVALNNSGNATIVPADVIDGSATDNCSNAFTYTLSKSFFDCTNVGANTVNVSVVDMAGNTTTLSATVTIVDDIDPTLTLANALVTVALDANGSATLGVSEVVGLAADNCSIQSVVLSQTAFDCSDLGNGTVTVTATDVNGNTTTATQNIVVVDLVAPVVTVKSTATVKQLDAAGSAVIAQSDILTSVSDNCTETPTVVWSPTTVSCAQVGPVTVSITVTDESGNVTTTTKVIQVVDELAPSLTTKSYTAVLNANGNATIVEANVVDSKSDNCGVPAVTLSKTVFDCTNKGANTVLVTATDVNGNATTKTAVVTVVDQTAPSMTLASTLTVNLNGSGTATISVPDVVTSAEDNCDVPTVTLSKYTYTCADMPSTNITVTAVDAAGNSTVETFTVNVVDALAPVITTKATATTIALDATGNASVVFADILSSVVDNCTSSPTVTWFPTTVSCAQVGPVTVSITTTDASGNVSTATKVIQVVDNINPTLVTKAYTAVLNANGNATVVESNVVQSKSDNCGVPAVVLSKTVFDCTNKGANNVTVTATDANGNVTTQTAVVTVVDQTAPFFTTAPSLTLLLNASGVATISVPSVVTSSGDNCDVPTVTLSKYTFTCADMPSTNITITAVDASGNTTTGTFTVNVLDQIAPVITPKATPTTIALDATGNAAVTLADVMGVALDNCTASPVVTWFPTTVSCAQVGPVTVTITAADASGNVSNATKVIQVIDNIAPTVVLNGNSLVTYTLPLNASGNATLVVGNVVASATDNCGTPVVSLSKTSFDCSNLGDNVVVVTATDQFGNVKTSNAIVKVVDVTAPSIVTPSTQVVLNLAANGTATLPLNQVMLSTTDNCGTPTVTWSPSTFSCANLGNNTVTITSTDASGNTTTATVVVLVQDVTAPVISTVSGVVTKVLGANGTVAITQSDVVASVADACDNAATVTWTPTSVSCANVGNVAVVVTAVDASGNVSTAVKTVLVVDQTAPVISAPASITLNLNAAGTVTLPAGVASATDNCAVNSIQYSKSLFDCANLGANSVTITATDVHGNASTSTMTVNVVDNTAPTLTLVASPVTVALNAVGSATINAAQLVANANDNCAVASFTVVPNTFNCSNLGGNTVTVTATDASGNATTQTVTVNVVDVTGPSITVNPAAVTVTLNASGVGSITNAQVVSSVTDNCTATPSVVVTPNVFTCSDLGQQMVTIFATDAAGNISTTTKLINVVDASAPVIVSAPQNVTLPGCNGNYTYAYQVTDNCGYTATLVSGLASGTQFPVGTTTVTWSFSDASGNTTTHSFNVTVLPLGTYTLPAVNEYCAGHGHFDLTGGQTGLVFYGSSVYNNGTTFFTEVPGLYALNYVYTDANGCTQNGVFNLIVRPRPAKPVVLQVAATTLESSVSGATYQWYRNEQLIVGAKNKQYSFTQGGKYEVVVFNAYGCGTMSEGFVISSNGLSVEEIVTSVRLFPNPTSSSVTLETSFEAAEDLQVTLVDMLGSIVYRGVMSKGSNQHVVDMSGLAAGSYNVILSNASGASSNVQRVVKID